MAINFVNSIDLNKNELQNAVIQNVTATPEGGTYSAGQAVYDTNATKLKIYNGSTWEQVGGSFTLRADGPAGANSYVVEPGAVVDLLGGTNMSVARGAGAASNQFTINTTATPDQDVALTGDVTGTLVLSSGEIATTLSAGVVTTAKFAATSLTISTEDFATNAVDTQVPTTLSVKNYVDEIVTGDLVFLGGLDASTGEITSGEFASSQLYNADTSARAVAADRYFVVTEPGDFFSNGDFPLTLGDRVVAAVAIPTNTVFDSTKIASDWTIIQSSNELATLTTVGIGNVGAGTATSGIDVTYSQGTASLVLDANELGAGSGAPVTLVGTNSSGATKKFTESDVHSARGKKIPLTTGTGIASAASGGITTWTITLSSAWQSGITGTDCMVEVYKVSDASTVYAEVARTSTTITVKFTGTAASGTYGVLLQNVG
jgi:hypothetical protein